MTEQLFADIEVVDSLLEVAADIENAIATLSNHPDATSLLTQEFRRLVKQAELNWQAIEQTAEFKANFKNRSQAQSAFFDLQRQKQVFC